MTSLIIFAAKYLFLASPVLCVAYMWTQPRSAWHDMALFAVVSLALTFALGKLASLFYYDPLPYVVGHFTPLVAHVADNGFPSDHGLFTAGLAAVMTVWSPRLAVVLWLVVLGVGAGRVYAGVHHPVDILASVFIAILATALVYVALRRVLKGAH